MFGYKGYFSSCRTIEDVKRTYRTLAKKLHPDCNPGRDTTEEFKKMQAEYTESFNRLKNVHEKPGAASSRTNKTTTNETYTSESSTEEQTAEEYADMIEKLLRIEGINIELIGSWIWVTGNTKPVKEELKALGFKFSAKKIAWCYHKEPWHHRGSKKDLNAIRNKYGSKTIKNAKCGIDDAAD